MSGVGLFCDHKKLRTTCPACKPAPPPMPAPKPAPKQADAEGEAKKRGPVAMLPKRPRRQKVSAEEAAQAEAWWVRRD